MIVLSDAEDCTIVCSFVWTKHQKHARQTDRDILWLLQWTCCKKGHLMLYKNRLDYVNIHQGSEVHIL